MLARLLPPIELVSPEERLLYNALTLTWLWYVLGALYVVPPALGWTLIAVMVWRRVKGDAELHPRPVTPLAAVWWIAMLVMLLAVIMGHLNWDLGLPLMIKSSIGWMKGWALFAVFVTIGGSLHVRPEVIYRASAVLALQTFALIPLFVVAPMIGLPGKLYISPMIALGGPGPEYFEVQLYGSEFTGGVRWRFFAPWAPAASVAYGILAPLILRERVILVRVISLAVVAAVVMMSKSRLGLIAIPVAIVAAGGLSRLTRPVLLIGLGFAVSGLSLMGETLLEAMAEQKERMNAMRADSSFVRETLARIALHRWETEAPVWGHGVVETGPHLVEFMPIGSHHSWYGLLFVKGAVGFCALLVPLLFTWGEMLFKAQRERTAQTAVALVGLFSFTTFTENVEMLAYLMWPAFVVIGIASRRRLVSPFSRPLARTDKLEPAPA